MSSTNLGVQNPGAICPAPTLGCKIPGRFVGNDRFGFGARPYTNSSPPTFWKVFPGPRGRPDLKNAPQKLLPDSLGFTRAGSLFHALGLWSPDFWGACLRSGRPRGPGKAFQKVGGEAPHPLGDLRGPRGHPDPQNDRIPILNKFKILSQSTIT